MLPRAAKADMRRASYVGEDHTPFALSSHSAARGRFKPYGPTLHGIFRSGPHG